MRKLYPSLFSIKRSKVLLFLLLLVAGANNVFAATASATYTSSDIPTGDGAYSAACNGPLTTLVVSIPAGAIVTGVDVNYDMTALGSGWISEQRSLIYCQETATAEGVYASGTGNSTGTLSYNRPGLTLANGVSASGILTFEMRAYRTYSGTAGCNSLVNKVDNNTWSITVTYTLPGPMSYTSSTTTQNNTGAVNPGATDQEIIGVEVVTSGNLTPFDVTQLRLRTNGSTDWSNDISGNIKVYYTGTSSIFATTTLFGSTAPLAPGNNISVNGTQTLSDGTNYFWVAYDISAGATVGNVVDALCNQITINGGVGNQTPTVTTPAGNRPISNTISISTGTSSYTTCNMSFFDDGGSAGNYSNNFDGTTTFYPAGGGCDVIELIFNSFALEGCCDYVSIYDGNSTSAPLMGSYNGTTNPGTFTSTAADGSLTFRFTSDVSGTPAGWDAAISCVTPANMSYVSTTTAQASAANVSACGGNEEIIRVEVVTTGACNAFDVSQLIIRTNGSTNALNDISNINVYYTGTSSTYATTTLFGNAAPLAPGNNITINGTQTLSAGTNYFWVAYDIAGGATAGNTLDALCNRVVVNSVNRTPATTAPAGTRTLIACVVSPGSVSSGLVGWFSGENTYSDNGTTASVNGGLIQQWTDISSVGNDLSQTIASEKPTYNSAAAVHNYYPYVSSGAGGTDYVSRSNMLGASSDGSVYFVAKTNTVSGYHHAVGFGAAGGTDPFDGDEPFIGIWASSMDVWQDESSATTTAGCCYEKRDFSGGPSITVDNSYIYSVKWTNGTANGIVMRFNGIEEVSASPKMRPGKIGSEVSLCGPTGSVTEYWDGNMLEVAIYSEHNSTTDSRKVESFLALKYGITLGINGTSLDYINSVGTTTWGQSANSGYNYDITGIGRDDNGSLDHTKTHSTNSSGGVYADVIHIVNGSNFSSPSSFGIDKSFLISGHNNGSLAGTAASFTTVNPEAVDNVFNRNWKTQETGTVGTITIEFDLSLTAAPYGGGANDLALLRLLVDADGDFTTGATSISPSSFNNATDIAQFQHDFAGGTGFFYTIAIVPIPLPVDLIGITATPINNEKVNIEWTTATEINCDYYQLERSQDGVDWSEIAIVNGAGNSNQLLHYLHVDYEPFLGNNYYRLIQYDFNGSSETFPIVLAKIIDQSASYSIVAAPVPAKNTLNITIKSLEESEVQLKLIDVLGQIIWNDKIHIEEETTLRKLDVRKLRAGIYFLSAKFDESYQTNSKIIIQK